MVLPLHGRTRDVSTQIRYPLLCFYFSQSHSVSRVSFKRRAHFRAANQSSTELAKDKDPPKKKNQVTSALRVNSCGPTPYSIGLNSINNTHAQCNNRSSLAHKWPLTNLLRCLIPPNWADRDETRAGVTLCRWCRYTVLCVARTRQRV